MTISEYLKAIAKQYRTGIAREHAYRGDLQQLLSAICPGVLVTNEPARIACGAPDYILTRNDIPVGYVEAKDIDVDLGSKSLEEQFDRYRGSLDNLIITDYLEFRFFKNGEPTATVRIGEVANGRIKALPENFDTFTALITDFAAWQGQTITSPIKLAAMMAGKARLLADVIEAALNSDVRSQANTDLQEKLDAFKTILIHDITPEAFSDLYAQTITYGMFAARLHDSTPDSFTRMEAAQLIPKSNPFLRKLFQNISGYDLDERIAWIVDALADIFRATDIEDLLSDFGSGSGREDAFMHFYEDFLAQYDPKLRKSRGVWYTPDAVVRFIVQAVDDVLQDDFGLSSGLADESTTTIKRKLHTKATPDRRSKGKDVVVEDTTHRVQVLDPATGTGTFLAEIVSQVHAKFTGQQGIWPQYVDEHLIPRLHGFELLMASYAMAHLKLDMVMRDTGYDLATPGKQPSAGSTDGQRLRVFLTNSLEEAHPDTGTLFANWLSQEANEANAVKRETPVMVVLGNPPYSGISSNMGKWISDLIEDYKYVDGEHFGERKHWLHDDYVKFIRLGEHFIEKTGEGVLAYINNHSFLDNTTFRGMRWHLLNTFDKIYVIDLHGDSKNKKVAPDGRRDENVFDIQQGVSINIFVRTGEKKKGQLGKVYHADMWGTRESKYAALRGKSLDDVPFEELSYSSPYFFMVPKDDTAREEYESHVPLDDLFNVSGSGITTSRDDFSTDLDKEALKARAKDFCDKSLTTKDFQAQYGLRENYSWKVQEQRELSPEFDEQFIARLNYRPFDMRFMYYQDNLVFRMRRHTMRHFLENNNLGLVVGGQCASEWRYVLVTDAMTDFNLTGTAGKYGSGFLFPLYLYPENEDQTTTIAQGVRPNLKEELVEQMANGLGLTYTFKPDSLFEHGTGKELTPLDVLDYCYAVLHSPAYRDRYGEFLKSDFPRIPFATGAEKFRALVRLGAKLRALHLLESKKVDTFVTSYPIAGSNQVTRNLTLRSPGWEPTGNGNGRVWINDTQYFDGVPELAWEFYIGGYQPAQKWLKDRRGRTLTIQEIRHYQRMIVALVETENVMADVDKVGVILAPPSA